MWTDQIGSAPPGLSGKPNQEEGFDVDLFVLAIERARPRRRARLKSANARAGLRAVGPQVAFMAWSRMPCLAIPPQRRQSYTVQ